MFTTDVTLTPFPVSLREKYKDDVFDVEFNGESYFCVVPTPFAEDFANDFETKDEAWLWAFTLRNDHPSGYWWDIGDKAACAAALWGMLGDVAVNEDDEIENTFLHFEVGTDKFEIWHWFEDEFDITLATTLING